jgi:lipopolysaccharide export system permease protein
MMPGVLGRYFARHFFRTVMSVFLGVFNLIFTVNLAESLRRSGDHPNVGPPMTAWLAFLHTPIVAEQALPFAVLLGAMIAFLNLSRRMELVVARAAGVSVWQFLAPAVAVALLIGAGEVAIYNPLSTAMKRQSETLEAKLYGSSSSNAGFWVRQKSVDGQTIIRVDAHDDNDVYLRVQAFNFDLDGTFSQRVDAERAILRDGYWEMRNATVVTPGFDAQTADEVLLASNLSQEQVSQAFVEPETVSFWKLSALASQVEQAGLNATAYRLKFQQLIAFPILLSGMVLLAACFSLRLFRMGGVQKMVLGGVASGFMLYIATKVVGDLGGVGAISPIVAGWLPAVVGCLIGVLVLLHQEDG